MTLIWIWLKKQMSLVPERFELMRYEKESKREPLEK